MELDSCLRLLDAFKDELRQVQKQIREAVSGDARAELLMSIPGIGETFSYLILYEVGEMERFRSAKKFASYCALVPSTHKSASRIWHGHMGRRAGCAHSLELRMGSARLHTLKRLRLTRGPFIEE